MPRMSLDLEFLERKWTSCVSVMIKYNEAETFSAQRQTYAC